MGSLPVCALPPELRLEGGRLFELSLRCLGRDVTHPDNLLLCRGLTRERLPPGQPGTSAYSTVDEASAPLGGA